MRILLAQNMFYLPSHGGANKSNRALVEDLAADGHACTVVAPLSGALGRTPVAEHVAYLRGLGADPRPTDEALVFEHRGVTVHVVLDPARLARYAHAQAGRAAPDRILVAADDPGGLILGAALRAAPDRVVTLVHTVQQLPFGPRVFYPSRAGADLLRRSAGIVTVSAAAHAYLHRYGGIDAELIHPPVYGSPPFPDRGSRADGAVTLVNPCAYKGIAIFLGLADALPEVPFLAVPTWGTTDADRAELGRRPNVAVVPAADDIDEILARTRVLLMPSLWDETFGYTCVEAMLRGIPVLASDVGGLPEAKLGVPYVLPVRPIERYAPPAAGHARPAPQVPPQDVGPWLATLRRLLTDPAHHAEVGARSRAAAHTFVTGLDRGALGRYLAGLRPAAPPATPRTDPAAHLGPAQRAALVRLAATRSVPRG